MPGRLDVGCRMPSASLPLITAVQRACHNLQ